MSKGAQTKKNKLLPVRAVCRNCGTHTVGRYCHICGQDLLAGTNHRLREILGDSLGTIWAWDSKVLITLWYLVAFPGRLTKEFYAGRIVRYVFPSKLFWFITIIFFALLLSVVKPSDNIDETAAATERTIEAASANEAVEAGVGDEAGAEADGYKAGVSDEEEDNSDLQGYLTTFAPYMVLFLVPVFALLVWVFWRRRERSYSDYLVFSLHFNAFVYLLFSVGLLLGKIFPGADAGAATMILLPVPAIYLGIALRRVYRPRIVPMILKIILLSIIYLITMILVLVLFLIAFAISIRKIDIFAG